HQRSVGDGVQALAERAVSDLVVALQEGHERRWRQVGARLAAARPAAKPRDVALVDEALRQRAAEPLDGRVGVGGVIAVDRKSVVEGKGGGPGGAPWRRKQRTGSS